MTFKVTHTDRNGCCRRLMVRGVPNNRAAMAWVEQLYGEARGMACICIRGRI